MRSALIMCFLLLPAISVAAVHRVPLEHVTIQAGIDASESGDTVLIAPGTYSGAGNTNLQFNGKGLTVTSSGGPESTIIDGQNSAKAFIINDEDGAASEISGLTIMDTAYSGQYSGGAILATYLDLVLRDMVFTGCEGNYGGALTFAFGELLVQYCVFEGNEALVGGGAISLSVGATAVIENCEFRGNQAIQIGGAISPGSADSIVIRDCLVENNIAHTIAAGGISVGPNATIERVTFLNNTSYWDAGALSLSGSDSTTSVVDCIFIGNTATRAGGAISMGAGFVQPGFATVENCLFLRNEAPSGGGGIAIGNESAPTIRNCTFIENRSDEGEGGGIRCGWFSTPTLESVLITGSVNGGGISVYEWGLPELICCDVWNNTGGDFIGFDDPTGSNGNISADPMFCDPLKDDYTLLADSPCAPVNNSCGVLIGHYDVGCDSVGVKAESWSGVKSLY